MGQRTRIHVALVFSQAIAMTTRENLFRPVPLLTVFAGILSAGLVPGLWSGRWVPAVTLDEAAARLPELPLVVGDWTGRDLSVVATDLAATQASGFIRRRYVNSRTGGMAAVMVLCGRPGPMAVHTPDACYRGAGYEEVGKVSRYEIPGSVGSHLWVRHFEKTSPAPVFLRVFYGWSSNGSWEAPDYPRLAFARNSVLYKLYVVRELANPDEPLDGDPAGDLLRAVVSPFQTILFPSA